MKIEDVRPGDLILKTYSNGEQVYILVKSATKEFLYAYLILWEAKTRVTPFSTQSKSKTSYGVTSLPFGKEFFYNITPIRLLGRIKK